MKIVTTLEELNHALKPYRQGSIGFVPTMGALHPGHESLVDASIKENKCTVVSIYVNPTQFGENEDFSVYPRTLEEDKNRLREKNLTILFCPHRSLIYPPGFSSYIQVEGVSAPLCGKFRSTYFQGVATVVARLFALVQPTCAYFGKKDIQQCLVIERMVKDLLLPVKLQFCPTVRESDGLALSSRNQYLSSEDRKKAPLLYKTLREGAKLYTQGEHSVDEIIQQGREQIQTEKSFRIQYLEILSYPDLKPLETKGKAVYALAAFLGETRLIDNIILGWDDPLYSPE